MPRGGGIPQIAWVVASLLLVAILGAASYFFVVRPRSQAGVSRVQTAPQPVSQIPQTAVPAAQAVAPVAVPAKTPTVPAAKKVEPQSRGESGHARPAASAKAGQLLVSSNVAGATVSVDGRSDPAWVTPSTIPDLTPGTHNVVISKDGYDNFQQSVTVEAGKTNKVEGNLSAPSGEIDVETNPPGVEVLIDGKSYGPSPVRATVPAGDHSYTVKRPGAEPYQSTFTMRSGAVLTKKLNLGTTVVTGIVEVRTIPPGATVLADGAPVGGQTPTSFRLATGPHTLVVSLSGYRPIQRQVKVAPSGMAPINIQLTSQ